LFGNQCPNPIHCAIGFTLFKYLPELFSPGLLFQHGHYRDTIVGRETEETFDSGMTTLE
jgi:hypothetical protein